MAFAFQMGMLLLLASGAWAAEKDLNEACANSDTCVQPNVEVVCDLLPDMCAIKQGQNCGPGFEHKCVSGSTCVGGTCTCDSGSVYSADAASGKCTVAADKWAGACNAQGACTDSNADCTDSMCVCKVNKKVNLADGTCSGTIAVKKVGYGCTVANQDTNCGTAENLACSADSVCACKEGYTGVTIGGDCTEVTTDGRVGRDCTTDAANRCPAAKFMECNGAKKCACITGYYGFAGSECTPVKNKVGGGCSGTAQGSCGANAECAGTPKKCSCKTGYSAKADLSACEVPKERVGRVCATEPDTANCGTKTATHLECSNNLCGCESGWTGQTTGVCTEVPVKKVGRTCSGSVDAANCGDAAVTHLECTALTCSCKTGYTGSTGESCIVEATKINGACTANSVNIQGNCADAQALCSATTNGLCFCKDGYTGTEGAGCAVTAGLIGGTCSGSGQGNCKDANAECSSTCSCKAGYTGATAQATCFKDKEIGGKCIPDNNAQVTQSDCVTTNSLCVNQKCACKDGYTFSNNVCSKIDDNTFGGACTTSSANTKGSCKDDNGLCSASPSGFCTCKANFMGTKGEGCAAANALGGSCTKSTAGGTGVDSCTTPTPNSECSMTVGGQCKCKAGFTKSGTKCSGAVGLGASLMVLLAAIYMAFMLH